MRCARWKPTTPACHAWARRGARATKPCAWCKAPIWPLRPPAWPPWPQQGPVTRVDVRMFGLFGPNGPLPLHMTAFARERRLHKGDHTFQAFADLFHHRLLLLFYRAWAQAQPTASLDRPRDDRFAGYVGSLIGVGVARGTLTRRRATQRPTMPSCSSAGVMSRQVRSADGLREPGGRLPAHAGARGVLCRPLESAAWVAASITSAVLGSAVFDRQHHIVGKLNGAARWISTRHRRRHRLLQAARQPVLSN
jgi:hypothetical protein